MEKAFRSRYVIGKPVRYHSRRGFFVSGNTTLRLGETDIGVCHHNLQGGLSHPCKCVLAWERIRLVQEKTLDRPAHYL